MGLFSKKKNTSEKEGDFSTYENVISKEDVPEESVSSDSHIEMNNEKSDMENNSPTTEDKEALTKLAHISEEIANGNLTIKINKELLERDDSIGALAHAMDEMISNFWYLVTKIRENADDISLTAEKLSANTEEVNASSEQASSSAQEIAKGSQDLSKLAVDSKQAVEGLIKAIDACVTVTKETTEHAAQANKIAERGGMEAEKAVEKMNSIKNSVSSSAEIIGELGEKSKQIHDIVDAINQISEQTNLLALNAAIEAARAGEAGRGFAVVADEVRKLAEESKQATSQIDGMISEIINITEKAVSSMEQGSKDVEENSTVINSALKSLEKIIEEVAGVSEQIEEIHTATDLQKGLSENVEKSIMEVSSVAQQSSAGAQEVSSSVQETTSAIDQVADMTQNLAQKAEELKNLMSTFTTE